jgi:hypothetical protein
MKLRTIVAAAAGVAVLSTSLLTGNIAGADPGPPTPRQLNGVGSDTTQTVLNGLSTVIPEIGSWNATGSVPFNTTGGPNCSFATRPNGSGAGVRELRHSLGLPTVSGSPILTATPNDCVDFARSSSGPANTTTDDLTFIPFGIDALTYAYVDGGSVPASLTVQDLTDIYTCLIPGFTPYLPQANSGTRASWLALLGINNQDVVDGDYPCIVTNAGIQEHDGTVIGSDPTALVPYGVGPYVAQTGNVAPNRTGNAVVGAVEGAVPFAPNPTQAGSRTVYNVVGTEALTGGSNPDATLISVFEGPSSDVCTAGQATIAQNGFGIHPDCGDTTLTARN